VLHLKSVIDYANCQFKIIIYHYINYIAPKQANRDERNDHFNIGTTELTNIVIIILYVIFF